jgi:hypothetical protein
MRASPTRSSGAPSRWAVTTATATTIVVDRRRQHRRVPRWRRRHLLRPDRNAPQPSRGFIIDCKDTPPDEGAAFWARSGCPWCPATSSYVRLDAREHDRPRGPERRARRSCASRHRGDDVEAECSDSKRSVPAGAEGADVVLEAPTGQRFCVVQERSRAQIWRESLVATRAHPTETICRLLLTVDWIPMAFRSE